MNITAEDFERATGHAPEQDDLERCNCDKAGQLGHDFCGWSETYGKPNFLLPYNLVRVERLVKEITNSHERQRDQS